MEFAANDRCEITRVVEFTPQMEQYSRLRSPATGDDKTFVSAQALVVFLIVTNSSSKAAS